MTKLKVTLASDLAANIIVYYYYKRGFYYNLEHMHKLGTIFFITVF
jgi:hypothetical protein